MKEEEEEEEEMTTRRKSPGPGKPTQRQMELAARCRVLEPYKVFNDIMMGPNPLTPEEVDWLIEKRPSLWGRFRAWGRRREHR